MEIDDGHKVLRVLQAAFPQYPNANGLPEDSVELYLRMLAEVNSRGEHLRDFADAMEAARHWVLSQDHFPLVGEMLDAIQREARKRAAGVAAGGLPPAWAGLDPVELPPGPAPERNTLDEAKVNGNIEAVRAALRSAVKRAPQSQYIEQERKARDKRPLEHCRMGDHSLCGDGPAGVRPKVK